MKKYGKLEKVKKRGWIQGTDTEKNFVFSLISVMCRLHLLAKLWWIEAM